MASPVTEVLPDAGTCRWCPHGQWSHKRGRGGCRELECGCDSYAPPKDRPAPEPVAEAVTVADVVLVEEARASVALDGETVALGPVVVGSPEPPAAVAEPDPPSPVDPVEVVDVVKRRRRKPVPLPGGDPVPDPAAQVEHVEQVAAIDEQLAQPKPTGDEPGSPEYLRKIGRIDAELNFEKALRRLQEFHDEALPTIDEAFSWRDQLDQADRWGQVWVGERDAARRELAEVRGELANLRREVVEREEQIARERGARLAELAQLREELARATAARQRIQDQFDTAVHTGLSAVSQVIGRYTAHACLECGARYGPPFTDHEHGPLTPVVVTIARADRPGPNTKEQ